MNIFKKRNDEAMEKFRTNCCPEILALVDRTEPVTLQEYKTIGRMNAYEQKLLIVNSDEELFLYFFEQIYEHCSWTNVEYPTRIAITYDEIMLSQLVPRMLKLYKDKLESKP